MNIAAMASLVTKLSVNLYIVHSNPFIANLLQSSLFSVSVNKRVITAAFVSIDRLVDILLSVSGAHFFNKTL